jgi:hypothetical protein
MASGALLDFMPLWLLFPSVVAVVFLAVEAGYYAGIRRARKLGSDKDPSMGAIVGAMLGLLGFMLAFTFCLAASRFNDRREVVLDEANAVGTTYLRAGMLAEPQRQQVRKLLRQYVEVRLEGVRTGNIDDALKTSVDLHDKLWSLAEAAAGKDRSPITGLFVASLNDVID